ncbi:MAG: twin-arginine translocase TatA/TatE family subunit [Acidimicrobiales bacterium]
MLSISPVKILIVAVVALVVLGPEKLPGTLRTLGRYWGEFQRFRGQFESQVRDAVGDLPLPVPGLGNTWTNPVRTFTDGFMRPTAPGTPGAPRAAVPASGARPGAGTGGAGASGSTGLSRRLAGGVPGRPGGDRRSLAAPGRLVPFPAELDPGYDDPICN